VAPGTLLGATDRKLRNKTPVSALWSPALAGLFFLG